MPVSLYAKTTISPTSNQTDGLSGGGSGFDFGQVTAGSYSNVVTQSANTGAKTIYLAHDGVNEVTDVKVFVASFTQSYGGVNSPSADFNLLKAFGNSSGNSKNNNDGGSGGLWIDMDWDATTANQFDQASFPTLVKIFGDNNTDGVDYASAFTIIDDAMVRNNAGTPVVPSAPVDGKIGPTGSTTLGDNALLKFRFYFPISPPSGYPSLDAGILQANLVFAYAFTS